MKGLRICHWNKANSAMLSKLSEIKNIISTHKPHCLGISEANININQDINIFNIADYRILLGPPSSNGIIRLVVYIHKDLNVKIRPDLMSHDLNSIWFEAGLRNQKKILINQTYREWAWYSKFNFNS